jgi:hypothetical protein
MMTLASSISEVSSLSLYRVIIYDRHRFIIQATGFSTVFHIEFAVSYTQGHVLFYGLEKLPLQ